MANQTTNNNTSVEKRLNGAAGTVQAKAEDFGQQFDRISKQAGEKVGEYASKISDSTTEYLHAGKDYVKEKPVKSVAIAAAAGLVLGSLLTLAMRRK